MKFIEAPRFVIGAFMLTPLFSLNNVAADQFDTYVRKA